jgi:hypothetical protein
MCWVFRVHGFRGSSLQSVVWEALPRAETRAVRRCSLPRRIARDRHLVSVYGNDLGVERAKQRVESLLIWLFPSTAPGPA